MKICEIVKSNREGHSADRDAIRRYWNEDCVIGLLDTPLGAVFVIKGKIKPFAYIYYKEGVLRGRGSYSLTKLEDGYYKKFSQAVELIEKNGKILDKKAWENMILTLGAEHI